LRAKWAVPTTRYNSFRQDAPAETPHPELQKSLQLGSEIAGRQELPKERLHRRIFAVGTGIDRMLRPRVLLHPHQQLKPKFCLLGFLLDCVMDRASWRFARGEPALHSSGYQLRLTPRLLFGGLLTSFHSSSLMLVPLRGQSGLARRHL
jgi:hypothetical protein